MKLLPGRRCRQSCDASSQFKSPRANAVSGGIGLVSWLLIFFGILGCSSIYYHPSRQLFEHPSNRGHDIEENSVRSADGTRIFFWRLPAHGKKIAKLLHFHGNAENMSTHYQFVEWLTQLGFEVITFDYRGYGRSDGDPEPKGVVEDGQAMLELVDGEAEPFVVFAQSLGGAISVTAVAESRPQHLVGMVLDSTFGSFRDLVQVKAAQSWLTWPLQWVVPWFFDDSQSPIRFVDGFSYPVLQVHGTADQVVPLSQGRLLFDALRISDKQWLGIPGSGHTQVFSGNFTENSWTVSAWLCDRLDRDGSCLKRLETFRQALN